MLHRVYPGSLSFDELFCRKGPLLQLFQAGILGDQSQKIRQIQKKNRNAFDDVFFWVQFFCDSKCFCCFFLPRLGPLAPPEEHGEDGGGRGGPLWMVFDGAVDLSWSEYLHAVLDESTAFPIPNSVERLPLREEAQ